MTRKQRTFVQHTVTYAVALLVLAGIVALVMWVVSLFGGRDNTASATTTTTTTTTTATTTTSTESATASSTISGGAPTQSTTTTTTTEEATATTTTTAKPTTTTTSTTATKPTTTSKPEPWEAAQSVDYYVSAFADRYAALHAKSPKLSPEDVVLKVNMNLDRPFYTDPIAIRNPSSLAVLCNKYYYLSKSYVPSDLVNVATEHTRNGAKLSKVANDAFAAMCDAAEKDGIELRITTAYRSYGLQSTLYNNYVAQDGKTKADTYSARPGYSEHQTGLAMDLGGKTPSGGWSLNYFEASPAFDWMQKHAVEYGFILRYPKDKVDITGYQYEPWHYRYVGKEVARAIVDEGLCYEEYHAKYLSGQTP